MRWPTVTSPSRIGHPAISLEERSVEFGAFLLLRDILVLCFDLQRLTDWTQSDGAR